MFEFFRARVFAAGLLFASLTAIPVVTISRFFGLFGLSPPIDPPIKIKVQQVKAEHAPYVIACAISLFSIFAYLFGITIQVLFTSAPLPHANYWWAASSVAAMAIAFVTRKKWLNSHPFPVAMVHVGAAALLLLSLPKWESREVTLAAFWFYGVGLAFISVSYLFLSDSRGDVKRFDWERWGFLSLAVVFFFATAVYGRIKPSWGGGVVSPVTVHFARATPFSTATDVKAFLIDETDKGYYLTHNIDDHKASFIPREAVASIDFEELSSQANH